MKKRIVILLALTLCLSLCACTKEPAPVETPETEVQQPEVIAPEAEEPVETVITLVPGETHEIPDYADLTLVRIVASNKLEASMAGGQYYTRDAEGEVFIDMVFDVVNHTADVIKAENVMTAVAVSADGTEYVCNIFGTETNDMTDFSLFGELAAETASRFHAAVSVPSAKTEFTLKFNVNGEEFTCEYSAETSLRSDNELTAGTVLSQEGFGQAEFLGWEFADAVYPTEQIGSYQFFQPTEEDHCYLVLKFLVTSQQEEAKAVGTFISARASVAGAEAADALTISENDDHRGLSNVNDLTPQAAAKVYCLVDIPSASRDQSFEAVVTFGGQEYIVAG